MPSTSSFKRVPLLAGALAGLLIGALVVAAIGLAAGTGRFGGESAQSKALKVLRADQTDLARMTQQVTAANRLTDLHDASATAARLVASARERDTALALLDDAKVKAQATSAHRATIGVLTAFADLKRVDESDLKAWNDSERSAVAALGELDAAAAPIAAMDAKRPLHFDSRRVEAAVVKTSTYLATSAQRLATYQRRMTKLRHRNRGRLQQAADYRATVLTQLGAYQQTRKDLQSYLNDAKDFGDQIVFFREALLAAKSKRSDVRATLAALTAPGAMQGEQQALVNVLDHAINATDVGVDLADATQRLRDEGDDYTSGFDLPEYREFVKQSDQITTERDAALANWTKSLDTYVHRLNHPRNSPTKPAI